MNHIEMPIWNKCNNRCVMCTNTEEMIQEDCFTFESVVNYFEEKLKENNYTTLGSISLTGGETTICPYLFKLLNYIRKRFPKVIIRILTNGRMFFYDSFRKECLSYQNIDFAIPLHGHNAEIHDGITQIPGSFHQTIEGLKKLLREKGVNQKVEIRIIANRHNLAIIPNFFEFIKNNFTEADRIVLIFLEFEGKAEVNKNNVGITYTQIQPALEEAKKYFKLFNDFRLYHFPLCALEPSLWPYAWRTLPAEEVVYLAECQKCKLKKYCLGMHKSYLNYIKTPEIKSWLNLDGIKIKATGNFHHPIDSIKIDKTTAHLEALTRLTDFLSYQRSEATKYFFNSMFFRLNKFNSYNAFEIKKMWVKAIKEIKKGKRKDLLSYYINIPFCESKCSYCMTPSVVTKDKESVNRYLARIIKEMAFYKDVFSGVEFNNIYIGGGSPSILNEKQLDNFLVNLFNDYNFSNLGEKTYECNPFTTTRKKLQIIKKFGFDRVSFGVQSLDPRVLKYANRSYQTYELVKKSILDAQSFGFTVNVDLLIGLKGDSHETVRKSFQNIIKLKPDNISLFPLKPTNFYLKKYFKDNEATFYLQIQKKIDRTLKLLQQIAIKFNYTYPDSKKICLSEWYGVNFSPKDKTEQITPYYNIPRPCSMFGIGSFSVSKIIGVNRYQNNSPIKDGFNASNRVYQGVPCKLIDDMRDYVLGHFTKGRPVSKKEFKFFFSKSLIPSFKHAFLALKKFKKVKINKDKVYFLPKDFRKMFIYGLFFWDKDKLIK
ncbi:radical SAM protein, partial [Patescibacteria group bacterium]|nr:radical SAM protein [Patescibacteria group bacterium]